VIDRFDAGAREGAAVRRWHLIEIEDRPWCPPAVRDGATDDLQFIIDRTRPYDAIILMLRRALDRTGMHRLVDLGSGAGGRWIALREALSAGLDPPVEVVLTDLHPNLPAFRRARWLSGGRIGYHEAPVDAARFPPEIEGFRSLFSSFHHFRPEEAALVLRDAVARR
jgi:hypothetical protein